MRIFAVCAGLEGGRRSRLTLTRHYDEEET